MSIRILWGAVAAASLAAALLAVVLMEQKPLQTGAEMAAQ